MTLRLVTMRPHRSSCLCSLPLSFESLGSRSLGEKLISRSSDVRLPVSVRPGTRIARICFSVATRTENIKVGNITYTAGLATIVRVGNYRPTGYPGQLSKHCATTYIPVVSWRTPFAQVIKPLVSKDRASHHLKLLGGIPWSLTRWR